MAARDVATLLALAHVGVETARRTNDRALLRDSGRLAVRALAHLDAGTFFAGLQVALAESAPRPTGADVRRGTLPVRSPVDAGAIPHDGEVRDEDRRHAERLGEQEETGSESGGMVRASAVHPALRRFAPS